jgi:hypothetical protein
MRLNQQDIVNAVCIHMAERKQVRPEEVEVELLWDEETGYSSEITVHGRSQYLVESSMVEAILHYVWSHYNQRAFADQVKLDIDEEMFAELNIQ